MQHTDLNTGIQPRLPLKTIIAAVCDHFKIGQEEIFTQSRRLPILFPRQIVYYLAIKLIRHRSIAAMARELKRDHTSLLHGRKRIVNLIANGDLHTIAIVEAIETDIASGKCNNSRPSLADISKSYMERQRQKSLSGPQVQGMVNGGGMDHEAWQVPANTGAVPNDYYTKPTESPEEPQV